MDFDGSCHCGAVTYRVTRCEEGATTCNCTICRRYGALWAYDWEGEGITVSGPTTTYVRGDGDGDIGFHFCPTCGCVAYWRGREPRPDGRRRMAVNVRLADPAAVAGMPIDIFDGLDTFTDLPRDGRQVRHLWS